MSRPADRIGLGARYLGARCYWQDKLQSGAPLLNVCQRPPIKSCLSGGLVRPRYAYRLGGHPYGHCRNRHSYLRGLSHYYARFAQPKISFGPFTKTRREGLLRILPSCRNCCASQVSARIFDIGQTTVGLGGFSLWPQTFKIRADCPWNPSPQPRLAIWQSSRRWL